MTKVTKNTNKANEPLYVLHGWTKDASKWNSCLKQLQKAGLKPKLLKIPGLTDKLDQVWDLNDYVNWFTQQVGNQKNINIICHSFGGRIAIRYTIKNPGQVKKLILIDSSGIRPNDIITRFKRVSFMTIAKLGKKITTNPKARQLLYKAAQEQDYHQADKLLSRTMAKIVADDQINEIPFIKSHTLIIWGEKDKMTPLSNGRYMHHQITGSTLKIIESARHSPQYTHPSIVSNHIINFIKGTH